MPGQKIRPMLATLADRPFDDRDWIFEIKWDGYRAIAENGDKTRLYSRNGNSFANDYPEIFSSLKKLPNDTIVDGEIIAYDERGRVNFNTLQMHAKKRASLSYAVFDILRFKGRDTTSLTLMERKKILKKVLPDEWPFILSEHIEEKGVRLFETAAKSGIEGIVAKRKESVYKPGVRSMDWLKIKHLQKQEAIICGFTEPRGGRKRFGSLVLGAYTNGRIKYIGHSGGGFTGEELHRLHDALLKIAAKSPTIKEKIPINMPITWVKPVLVAEVEFTEWTPDSRMRHPTYAGLREDKDPKDVTIERPAAVIPALHPYVASSEGGKAGIQNSDKINKMSKLELTNLDKIFWPEEGYTKGDVIEYYDKISDYILPYLKDRPLSLNRHPNGINGESFFQKNITHDVPEFAATKKIWSESNNEDINYILCRNKETLLYLANLGCIELNPWNSRIQNLDNPDYMIIDLDPSGRPFEDLIEVAMVTREVLDGACGKSYVKTSGKRGLHILVPLGAKYHYDDIRIFCELLVRIVNTRMPKITSIERNPAKRKKKIYLDYLQNRKGQTLAAPYSLRPVEGATVSTPLKWSEVKKGLDPKAFTIETIVSRLKKVGDPWESILTEAIDLNESVECLQEYIKKL